MKFIVHCAICAKQDQIEDAPPVDAKYLCPKCYQEVKVAYERQYPDQKLGTFEVPEDKKHKVN